MIMIIQYQYTALNLIQKLYIPFDICQTKAKCYLGKYEFKNVVIKRFNDIILLIENYNKP